ncbi:hypothetical protein KCP74_13885 [Salmonella enterica subsp. enterica]|nr:hypothetical protein KCP74_13885 [Salmonella enterica subsp. enterica]
MPYACVLAPIGIAPAIRQECLRDDGANMPRRWLNGGGHYQRAWLIDG